MKGKSNLSLKPDSRVSYIHEGGFPTRSPKYSKYHESPQSNKHFSRSTDNHVHPTEVSNMVLSSNQSSKLRESRHEFNESQDFLSDKQYIPRSITVATVPAMYSTLRYLQSIPRSAICG